MIGQFIKIWRDEGVVVDVYFFFQQELGWGFWDRGMGEYRGKVGERDKVVRGKWCFVICYFFQQIEGMRKLFFKIYQNFKYVGDWLVERLD